MDQTRGLETYLREGNSDTRSNKLKVLVRFTFKQENFKPKTDQSEMVSGGVPSQHAVRREGEWLPGLLAELAHQGLNEGQDINLVGIGYPA